MISAPVYLAALLTAALTARHEPRHRAVVGVYVWSLAFVVASLLHAPERDRAMLLTAISGATSAAYVSAWAPPRWGTPALVGIGVAWTALVLWIQIGEPSWELAVVRGPLVASCLVGLVLMRRARAGITDAVLLVMLLGDGAGLALLRYAPGALKYEGRVQALVVAALHVAWLARRATCRTPAQP